MGIRKVQNKTPLTTVLFPLHQLYVNQLAYIAQHLSIYNILSDTQFGFRLKHLCESQLLVT